MRTALVIGSTGLVGSELIKQLLDNPDYDQVVSLHRRKTGLSHEKLVEHLVDFNNLESDKHYFDGDVLFSCMGTTLKTAGSKERQYQIDFQYQLDAAKIAQGNGVKEYVLISSAGANSTSSNFYTRMKGELEDEIEKLAFQRIRILQPSILDGNRNERRVGESIGLFSMRILKFLPIIRKWRPIHASIVAKAMQKSLSGANQLGVYKLEEIFELAED